MDNKKLLAFFSTQYQKTQTLKARILLRTQASEAQERFKSPFALPPSLLETVRHTLQTHLGSSHKPLKLFISHAWENYDLMLQFHTALTAIFRGFDVQIISDKNLAVGTNIASLMEGLPECDVTFVLATPEYIKKASVDIDKVKAGQKSPNGVQTEITQIEAVVKQGEKKVIPLLAPDVQWSDLAQIGQFGTAVISAKFDPESHATCTDIMLQCLRTIATYLETPQLLADLEKVQVDVKARVHNTVRAFLFGKTRQPSENATPLTPALPNIPATLLTDLLSTPSAESTSHTAFADLRKLATQALTEQQTEIRESALTFLQTLLEELDPDTIACMPHYEGLFVLELRAYIETTVQLAAFKFKSHASGADTHHFPPFLNFDFLSLVNPSSISNALQTLPTKIGECLGIQELSERENALLALSVVLESSGSADLLQCFYAELLQKMPPDAFKAMPNLMSRVRFDLLYTTSLWEKVETVAPLLLLMGDMCFIPEEKNVLILRLKQYAETRQIALSALPTLEASHLGQHPTSLILTMLLYLNRKSSDKLRNPQILAPVSNFLPYVNVLGLMDSLDCLHGVNSNGCFFNLDFSPVLDSLDLEPFTHDKGVFQTMLLALQAQLKANFNESLACCRTLQNDSRILLQQDRDDASEYQVKRTALGTVVSRKDAFKSCSDPYDVTCTLSPKGYQVNIGSESATVTPFASTTQSPLFFPNTMTFDHEQNVLYLHQLDGSLIAYTGFPDCPTALVFDAHRNLTDVVSVSGQPDKHAALNSVPFDISGLIVQTVGQVPQVSWMTPEGTYSFNFYKDQTPALSYAQTSRHKENSRFFATPSTLHLSDNTVLPIQLDRVVVFDDLDFPYYVTDHGTHYAVFNQAEDQLDIHVFRKGLNDEADTFCCTYFYDPSLSYFTGISFQSGFIKGATRENLDTDLDVWNIQTATGDTISLTRTVMQDYETWGPQDGDVFVEEPMTPLSPGIRPRAASKGRGFAFRGRRRSSEKD